MINPRYALTHKEKMPIIVLISKGYFREELRIYQSKTEIQFEALIDGTAQRWVITKEMLFNRVKI